MRVRTIVDNDASAENVTRGYNIPGDGEIGTMERWTSLKRDWANAGNTPFRFYKNYSFEGGICTPFIARWPAVIREARVNHTWAGHFIDIMPTFIELTGARYPAEYKLRILKEVAEKHGVKLEECVAIGDGANDLLVIRNVGLGIGFNPKRVVREQAKALVGIKDMRAVLAIMGAGRLKEDIKARVEHANEAMKNRVG